MSTTHHFHLNNPQGDESVDTIRVETTDNHNYLVVRISHVPSGNNDVLFMNREQLTEPANRLLPYSSHECRPSWQICNDCPHLGEIQKAILAERNVAELQGGLVSEGPVKDAEE